MELLQLNYFLKLAEYEHLTQVAEMMYVSPSAISSSIARLEDELGVKLFDRIGRNIKLNQYGKTYLPYVERALSQLNDGKKEILDMNISSNKNLTIVMNNPYLWQNSLHDFSQKHPDIVFKHFLFDPVLSATKSPSSDIDLMIMAPESFSNPAWDYIILFEDRIALAVPPDHPFAHKDSISLYEARDEWFVNLADSTFSRYCTSLCHEAGFEPKSRITCDYMLRSNVALREGMVALTTFNCKNGGLFSDMKLIPLSDKRAARHQAVFWPKSRYLSQPAKLLKDFLVDTYRDFSIYD